MSNILNKIIAKNYKIGLYEKNTSLIKTDIIRNEDTIIDNVCAQIKNYINGQFFKNQLSTNTVYYQYEIDNENKLTFYKFGDEVQNIKDQTFTKNIIAFSFNLSYLANAYYNNEKINDELLSIDKLDAIIYTNEVDFNNQLQEKNIEITDKSTFFNKLKESITTILRINPPESSDTNKHDINNPIINTKIAHLPSNNKKNPSEQLQNKTITPVNSRDNGLIDQTKNKNNDITNEIIQKYPSEIINGKLSNIKQDNMIKSYNQIKNNKGLKLDLSDIYNQYLMFYLNSLNEDYINNFNYDDIDINLRNKLLVKSIELGSFNTFKMLFKDNTDNITLKTIIDKTINSHNPTIISTVFNNNVFKNYIKNQNDNDLSESEKQIKDNINNMGTIIQIINNTHNTIKTYKNEGEIYDTEDKTILTNAEIKKFEDSIILKSFTGNEGRFRVETNKILPYGQWKTPKDVKDEVIERLNKIKENVNNKDELIINDILNSITDKAEKEEMEKLLNNIKTGIIDARTNTTNNKKVKAIITTKNDVNTYCEIYETFINNSTDPSKVNNNIVGSNGLQEDMASTAPEILQPLWLSIGKAAFNLSSTNSFNALQNIFNIDITNLGDVKIMYPTSATTELYDSVMILQNKNGNYHKLLISSKAGMEGTGASASISGLRQFLINEGKSLKNDSETDYDYNISKTKWENAFNIFKKFMFNKYNDDFYKYIIETYIKNTLKYSDYLKKAEKKSKKINQKIVELYLNDNDESHMQDFVLETLSKNRYLFCQINSKPSPESSNDWHYINTLIYPAVFTGKVKFEIPPSGKLQFHIMGDVQLKEDKQANKPVLQEGKYQYKQLYKLLEQSSRSI